MESFNSGLKLGVVGQEEGNGLAGEQFSQKEQPFSASYAEIRPKMKCNQTKKRNILDLFL